MLLRLSHQLITKMPFPFSSLRCNKNGGRRSEVEVFSFSHFYQQLNCDWLFIVSLGECQDNNPAGWQCIGCGACGVWAFLRPSGHRHLQRNRFIVLVPALPLFRDVPGTGPVTYTFTVNTAVPDADPSPTHGFYPGALISSSGQIGSYQFSTGSGDVDINLAAPQSGDWPKVPYLCKTY